MEIHKKKKKKKFGTAKQYKKVIWNEIKCIFILFL